MDDTPKKPKGAGKSSFEFMDPDLLKAALPVGPGSVVLDLACGKGAYSLFLSGIVGNQGLVHAVDLWEEGIMLLEEEIETRNLTNIMTLVADAAKEIDIEDDSLDLCLMATVLHDFEEAGQTGAVLKTVKTLLRPGGCLAVVEFKKMEGPPGPPVQIRLSDQDTDRLVTPYGFKKGKTVDMGEYHYLTTFLSI
ncbi:MAG: methyltransferase domain-containing protein [Desulfobacula sp.]|nr:methyltransferase domain-containing protein [Desulfobacula sp.]